MADEVRIESLESSLDRLLVWIQAADTKGTIILAMDTGMLGVLSSCVPVASRLGFWSGAFAVVATALLVSSGIQICWVTVPRVDGPRRSMIFFGGIAEYEREEFVRCVRARRDDEYINDLALQIHRNGEIAKLKYRHVASAMALLQWSITPWLVGVYLLYREGRQ